MFALLTLVMATLPVAPPAPVGPVPSEAQVRWQRNEFTAFVHFGPNTFTGNEWGQGTEDPRMFNPTELNADQWAKTFKGAGMKSVIITAKHHDGFCLWPSKYSTHSVAQSPWRGGKGDVLKELSEACKANGLTFGVYLSPWDRNHPQYGTPGYNQVFVHMLGEVLGNYGAVSDMWFDGANGEGPNGKKQVYDWPLFNGTVAKYQPEAVTFSDAGPGCRWVGNEDGFAGETCWSAITKANFSPGHADTGVLNRGEVNGTDWIPAECDVSIRPGWFYKKDQDKDVKSVDKLMDIWYGSVGRNGHLLLNVPADKRGLISEVDVQRLKEFKAARDATFKTDIARKATVTASVTRGAGFEATRINDGNWESYWAAPDGVTRAEITLDFGHSTECDHVVLQEQIRLGQRVESFHVLGKVGSAWETIATGTTIGYKRILKFEPRNVSAIRVAIDGAKACPALNAIGVYRSQTPKPKNPLEETPAQKAERLKWWKEARFGMFIHWGLYSVPAGYWNGKAIPGIGEWIQTTAKIKPSDYEPLQKQFNPVNFDAKRWVQIAKDAGMKYIVITSKHHDGFCLFDSKLTDWDIMGTPFHRDVLKELSVECKKQGIRLCFYHSIMDWHNPNYLPRRAWDDRPGGNMDAYNADLKGQLKELLTNYGPLGILWFDGQWESTWTHERGQDLYNYVRSLQPNIIVNNRVDKGALMGGREEHAGDYGTPEQEIPANGLPGIDWESCMTMNDTWGFKKDDNHWKSAKTIVENLVDCVSKGGNYLLNVGPTPLGEIPGPSVDRLAQVGKWLKANGESVYGAKAGPFMKPFPWGRVTQKPGRLYVHVFDSELRSIDLPGLTTKIGSIHILGKTTRLKTGYFPDPENSAGRLSIALPADRDPLDTVVVLEYSGPLSVQSSMIGQAADGSVTLPASEADLSGGLQYEKDKNCIGYWTSADGTVKWPFNLKTLGEYKLTAEVACPADTAGSEVQVEIAGDQVKFKVPATGAWDKFVTLDLGRVSLVRPGRMEATVRALSKPGFAVMNLRSLKLSRP